MSTFRIRRSAAVQPAGQPKWASAKPPEKPNNPGVPDLLAEIAELNAQNAVLELIIQDLEAQIEELEGVIPDLEDFAPFQKTLQIQCWDMPTYGQYEKHNRKIRIGLLKSGRRVITALDSYKISTYCA